MGLIPFHMDTDDGGHIVEYECAGRDVSFVTPAGGHPMYFVAHGESGFRRAGIVTGAGAPEELIAWVAAEGRFPQRGLDIGTPRAST